jgi:hypothetical protein
VRTLGIDRAQVCILPALIGGLKLRKTTWKGLSQGKRFPHAGEARPMVCCVGMRQAKGQFNCGSAASVFYSRPFHLTQTGHKGISPSRPLKSNCPGAYCHTALGRFLPYERCGGSRAGEVSTFMSFGHSWSSAYICCCREEFYQQVAHLKGCSGRAPFPCERGTTAAVVSDSDTRVPQRISLSRVARSSRSQVCLAYRRRGNTAPKLGQP